MDGFRVPYGVDNNGQYVSSDDASKDITYSCPCCAVKLIYKSGEIRAKHFSHPANSNCTPESILHKIAKSLITKSIEKNAEGKLSISIIDFCQACGVQHEMPLSPKTFSSSTEETKVGEFICDVVAYRDSKIALGIEIFATHKVDKNKSASMPIYWIELKAEDVIKSPAKWITTQSKLKQNYCKECKEQIKKILSVADKYGIDRILYSPIKNPKLSNYIAAIENCFKCKQDIPVFWWSGVPFCESEPPLPRPKTIKYRNSKQYGGSYWANTCASCNMIQGDNYLFLFDNAPLGGLPMAAHGEPDSEFDDPKNRVKVIQGRAAVSEMEKVIRRNFGYI